ncbi:hypothetical protein NPIL_448741 [Nephila pilipes]|uniref:Uncharacterized protein n=1 Tax=Nephila pilipes TaxID=299642 RepID=A0A8X6U2T3_NEPPI|nr:hypothetical protein NPIL_448741 [Nephila pilipes]
MLIVVENHIRTKQYTFNDDAHGGDHGDGDHDGHDDGDRDDHDGGDRDDRGDGDRDGRDGDVFLHLRVFQKHTVEQQSKKRLIKQQ